MKKRLLFGIIVFPLFHYAQVGINTTTPAATLDVTAKNTTGTATNVDGLLIPRVDRQRAQSMASIPTSTIIYVNSIATGTQTGTAANINAVGYYSYDGSVWVKINTGNDVNIYNSDGTLTANRTVEMGTNFLRFQNTASGPFFRILHTATDGQATLQGTSRAAMTWSSNAASFLDILQDVGSAAQISIRGTSTGLFLGSATGSTAPVNLMANGATALTVINGGNVGIGTATPNANALLELSSASKGLLLPRLALTATNNASPLSAHVAGMEVYNTVTNTSSAGNEVYPGEYINDGTKWGRSLSTSDVSILVGADGTDAVATSATITVPSGSNVGVNTNLSTFNFTLTRPSLVTFSANVSASLTTTTGSAITDGVPRLYRVYWQFTTVPAGSTITTGTAYGPSSGIYTGASPSGGTTGNMNTTPNMSLKLIPGSYTVVLTGLLTNIVSSSYNGQFGAAANDNVSIVAIPIK
ncbi:hypothetical protein SAMN05421866_1271 [Chryseobacterium oranimense]|uniref:Uncharacterized protein n=1 Tax=Chryseobacterium oranimense TaxID=421058 RepID=A0A1M5LZB8_9FLAO|nr:hypothetical protein [Chryseobacterium oranimense]SHG70371.1 hypothetical protein SAMN05421866_1271 [Chryseobacterium oranimense]